MVMAGSRGENLGKNERDCWQRIASPALGSREMLRIAVTAVKLNIVQKQHRIRSQE